MFTGHTNIVTVLCELVALTIRVGARAEETLNSTGFTEVCFATCVLNVFLSFKLSDAFKGGKCT